jgi:hypothetical protein
MDMDQQVVKVHAKMIKECEVWTVGLGPPVTYLADATKVAVEMIKEAWEAGYQAGYDTAYLDWKEGHPKPDNWMAPPDGAPM